VPSAEEQKLLAQGREFIELGDIASARLVLEHAARLGSKAAMLALAKTYDPKHLAALGVQGVQPDINLANAWYERASRKADR
jgi:TPR repeat protein